MFLTADLSPEVEMMAMLTLREDGHECPFKALVHQKTDVLLFQAKFKVIINLIFGSMDFNSLSSALISLRNEFT